MTSSEITVDARRQILLAAPVVPVDQVPALVERAGLNSARLDWPPPEQTPASRNPMGYVYFGTLHGSSKLGFTRHVPFRLAALQLKTSFLIWGASVRHETALRWFLRDELVRGRKDYFEGPKFTALMRAGETYSTVRFGELPDGFPLSRSMSRPCFGPTRDEGIRYAAQIGAIR